MDGKNDSEATLSEKQLQTLLHDLVEKQVITQRIADTIFQKIQEKQATLRKKDLFALVNTISKKTHANKNFEEVHKSKDSEENMVKKEAKNTPVETKQFNSWENTTESSFKKLNDELTHIEEKIGNIEEIQHNLFDHNKPTVTDSVCTQPTEYHFDNQDMQPLKDVKNTPENVVVLMKWLQYLSDKLGQDYLSEVLEYYVTINWITEDVRLDLIKYAKGISFGEKTDKDHIQKPSFTIDDHLQSFLFIQKLKGSSFQDDFLLKLNSKIEKMGENIRENISKK